MIGVGKRMLPSVIIIAFVFMASLSSCAGGRKTHDWLFGANPLILEFEYSPGIVVGTIHKIFVENGYDVTRNDDRLYVKDAAEPGHYYSITVLNSSKEKLPSGTYTKIHVLHLGPEASWIEYRQSYPVPSHIEALLRSIPLKIKNVCVKGTLHKGTRHG